MKTTYMNTIKKVITIIAAITYFIVLGAPVTKAAKKPPVVTGGGKVTMFSGGSGKVKNK